MPSPRRHAAIRMIEEGYDNARILSETGQAVGVVDASFDVKEGETLVVMGLSGSGKSTLIRCINRLIEPTRGKVWVDDDDVTALLFVPPLIFMGAAAVLIIVFSD